MRLYNSRLLVLFAFLLSVAVCPSTYAQDPFKVDTSEDATSGKALQADEEKSGVKVIEGDPNVWAKRDAKNIYQYGLTIPLEYKGMVLNKDGFLVAKDGKSIDYDALIQELIKNYEKDYAVALSYLNRLPSVEQGYVTKSDKTVKQTLPPTPEEARALIRLKKWGTLINQAMVGAPVKFSASEEILKAKLNEIESRLNYQRPYGLWGFDQTHFQTIGQNISETLLERKAGGKLKYTVYAGGSGKESTGYKDFKALEAGYLKAKSEYQAAYDSYYSKPWWLRLFSFSEKKQLDKLGTWLSAHEIIYSSAKK
ncbi:MAG: hypothetical protein ACD_39C00095G0005 [uncultured bacterium]|nr:MAG: hypothetical protein ACD_39C00095G0005 [uncultured bacterium]